MDEGDPTGADAGLDQIDETTEMLRPSIPEDDSGAPMNEDARAQHDEQVHGLGPLHEAAIYDTTVDPSIENDAHSFIVNLVGEGKRVLELGCATGSTTKVLQQQECTVVGIEIDGEAAQIAEQFAERVIVADLDLLDVHEALGEDSFDVIVAADVLEHLRDPKRVLTACVEHLRPGGEVLLSIPNVAHADVRLSLLRGDFDYQVWGILDETHLRFFTRRSLTTFLRDCGLAPLTWDRTQRALGQTEIEWVPVEHEELVEWVANQPDADTYQFIVRAAAAAEGSHIREVVDMLGGAWAEVSMLRANTSELELRRGENERLVDAVAQLESLVANLQVEVGSADERTRVAEENARSVEDRLRAMESVSQAEVSAMQEQLRLAGEDTARVAEERDSYRASFDVLAGVQEQLVEVRRSESFRLGRLLLSPITTTRRFVRAWRRAKS